MKPRLEQSLQMKPQQRLAMTMAMQSALRVLQMGTRELSDWLQEEIEQNPLLESVSRFRSEAKEAKLLPELPARTSLSDYLWSQAREAFSAKEDLKAAEAIIANLDQKGYLAESIETLSKELKIPADIICAVLKIIQTFEPSGIAARDLQECLLIQLEAQKKQQTIAYQLIKDHYAELVQGKMSHLRKKLKISSEDLQKNVLKELRTLHFHPADLETLPTIHLYPDLLLKMEKKKWIVEVNEKDLPAFHFNERYTHLLKENISSEERETVRGFMAKGKWLMRSINRRRKILRDIAFYIVKRQQGFLLGKEALLPLSAKEIADALTLNESTVARALSEKYIDTPFGIKPLRFFLSHALKSGQGEKRSAKAAIEALREILDQEDKSHPFTDQELSEKMQAQGFYLARRTITKYRIGLKTGSKGERRKL